MTKYYISIIFSDNDEKAQLTKNRKRVITN